MKINLNEYVLVERPVPGHENYVMRRLVNRYQTEDFKYVLVLHLGGNQHFILGLFKTMRECLIARYYANTGIDMSDDQFFQAHEKDGPVIDLIFDIEHNTVREQ